MRSFTTVSILTCLTLLLNAATNAAPLDKRQVVTTPYVTVDGSGVSQAVGSFSEFSPIEDGFLEGDNDSGGESKQGGTAVSVANGLTGGGSGASSNSNGSSTSTSSFCSVSGCTSGAGAANQNNTSTSTSSSGITVVNGPLTNGPLITAGGRRLLRFLA